MIPSIKDDHHIKPHRIRSGVGGNHPHNEKKASNISTSFFFQIVTYDVATWGCPVKLQYNEPYNPVIELYERL